MPVRDRDPFPRVTGHFPGRPGRLGGWGFEISASLGALTISDFRGSRRERHPRTAWLAKSNFCKASLTGLPCLATIKQT